MSRHSIAPKSRYRHITRAKAEEIRRAYFAREANQCQLAERFGISQGSVSRIVSGQVWA
jgi:DNA-binding transcriptional regulator LsrR (DeoR family)